MYQHSTARETIKTFGSLYGYLPVVMPQLSITGDQVDPLTLRRLFFFKCKNVDSLSQVKEISAFLSNCKFRFENLRHWLTRPSLHDLFAALSETDGRILARKEPPDRGRLTRPQSRLVGWRQRVLMEWLSELLNLLQPRSPLTHFSPPLNCLVTAELLACRFFWEKG